MSNPHSEGEKIIGTDEAWESGQLGADPRYAKVASPEVQAEVRRVLGAIYGLDEGIGGA